jgi:hypothetical protein
LAARSSACRYGGPAASRSTSIQSSSELEIERGWTARIDQRIAELERLKLGLAECIGCGCLSLDRCKLANPQDRAAGFGPGPRYWIGARPLGR